MKYLFSASLHLLMAIVLLSACSSEKEEASATMAELFPVKEKSRYGYMNSKGEMVVTPAYDYAWNFKDGMGRVKLNGKYGFLNEKGEVVITPSFAYADDFQDGFARINTTDTTVLDVQFDGYSLNAGWTFINKKGNVYNETFAKAEYLRTGYAQVKDDPSYEATWEYATLRENGLTREAHNTEAIFVFNGHQIAPALEPESNKIGAINHDEQWIIQPEFDAMESFSEGFAAAKKGNAYGYIDLQGKWIYKQVMPVNEYVYLPTDFKPFSNGLAAVKLGKEAYGYINTSGQQAFQQRFRAAYSFNKDGYAIATNESGSGLIDKSGAFIVKPNIDIVDIVRGVIIFRNNLTFGAKDLKTQKEIVPAVYDNVEVVGDLIKVTKKGATYGFINEKGEFVVAPQFDYAWPFKAGKAIVQQKDVYQYINRSGKLIGEVPTELQPYYYKPSTDLYARLEEGKFGFTSAEDKLIIPASYDFATDFEGTVARVNIGATFSEDDWLYAGGKWGLIDRKGASITPAAYELILPFKNGVALFNEGGEATYSLCDGECEETVYYNCAGGKWGIMDVSGKKIMLAEFDRIIPFDDKYLVGREGIYTMIDKAGKTVYSSPLEIQFDVNDDNTLIDYSGKKFMKAFENGKAGIIDSNGKWLLEPAFSDILLEEYAQAPFVNDLVIVKNNESWGVADISGTIIIPTEYDELRPFSNNLAAARKNERWGFIDINNTLVVEHKYYSVRDFQDGVAIVQAEETSAEGVIDKTGALVFSPEEGTTFDYNGFVNGLCVIYGSVENKSAGYPVTTAGVIDNKGKVIFNKSALDEARIQKDGIIYAVKNGKWAMATKSGAMLTGYNYSWIEPYNGQSLIRCNIGGEASYADHGVEEDAYGGRWGYIDNKGDIKIPFTFSEAGTFSDGLAPARTSEDLDEIGYITLDGKWVRPLTR